KAFIALAIVSVAVLPSAWASDAPAVRFTPNAHDFGTHDIGTTAKVSFVLENQGKSQLNLQSISIKGSNPDFFVVQNDCPRSLAPKKACTVVVGFSPTTDRRVEPNNAPDLEYSYLAEGVVGTATAKLSGVGYAPDLTVSPRDLQFGPQAVLTRSPAQ